MFAMVANRLVVPCPKLRLAEWVEMDAGQTQTGLYALGGGGGGGGGGVTELSKNGTDQTTIADLNTRAKARLALRWIRLNCHCPLIHSPPGS